MVGLYGEMDVSKVSEAKAAQGYTMAQARCSTCEKYRSDKVNQSPAFSWVDPYTTEKNRRCRIGGFAVKASAICKLYERKS